MSKLEHFRISYVDSPEARQFIKDAVGRNRRRVRDELNRYRDAMRPLIAVLVARNAVPLVAV